MNAMHKDSPQTKNILQLIEEDEQAALILQVNALAYQINQAAIAEVQIIHSVTLLHVIVKRHFQDMPQISANFSLADADMRLVSHHNMTRSLLIMRLRSVVHDLQTIYEEGSTPHGTAA